MQALAHYSRLKRPFGFWLLLWLASALASRAQGQDGSELYPRLRGYLPEIPTQSLVQPKPLDNNSPLGKDQTAKDEDKKSVIEDNSFLIEEAYNQEAGIVQHIFNFEPGWDHHGGHTRTFDFLFTQEWPICSQTHQFSYQIPASHIFEHLDGEPSSEVDGLGDIQLNYRLQLLGGEGQRLWCAPRFSVILPTGDEEQGLGTGEVGYQTNLPISREFEWWTLHLNAGLTVTPDVKAVVQDPTRPVRGQTLHGYNLGASGIYFLKPNFHLMLESVAMWDEEAKPSGGKDHTFEWLLNPGFRWAPYTKGDTQLVLGIGLPIGLSSDATDISVFFYLSFEHRFKEEKSD
jgi:hypothetical protein